MTIRPVMTTAMARTPQVRFGNAIQDDFIQVANYLQRAMVKKNRNMPLPNFRVEHRGSGYSTGRNASHNEFQLNASFTETDEEAVKQWLMMLKEIPGVTLQNETYYPKTSFRFTVDTSKATDPRAQNLGAKDFHGVLEFDDPWSGVY